MHYRSLYWQIVKRMLLTICLPSTVLILILAGSLRQLNRAQIRQQLLDQGRDARAMLLRDQRLAGLDPEADFIGFCNTIQSRTGARTVIITDKGDVMGDSRYGSYKIEAPLERHEIRLALDGMASTSIRKDSVTGKQFLDASLPIRKEREIIGAINLSLPWSDWGSVISELVRAAILPFVGLIVLMLIAAHYITSHLGKGLYKLTLETAALAGKTRPDSAFEGDPIQQLSTEMTTMRRKVQDQIRVVERDKRQWEALFTSMHEGFLAVDDALNIITVNDAARRFLQLPIGQDIAGEQLFNIVRNADLNEFCGTLIKDHCSFRESEIEVRHDDAKVYVLRLSGARFEQYKYVGAIIIISDITRIRHLEEGRTEFVANVSHELKTPLAAIKGYIETLADSITEDPEFAHRAADVVARNATRMNAIIDDLLTLSRLEVNMEVARREFEEHDLQECINHAIDLHERRVSQRDITLKVKTEKCIIAANHRLLEHAVSNLLDNAIKYSPEGAKIKIRLYRENGCACIQVRDNGPGIPLECQEAVFERFYRVDKSRDRQTGGTGLGLAIVKHICRLHDGSVTLESTTGKGSTFTIQIPYET